MSKKNKSLIVCFYKNASDKQPVRDWLLKLNIKDRQVIGCDIKTVEFGWPIGMPVCKALGKGLYEVRSSLQDNRIARIIFCIECNNMILLHSFIKKTQQTPNKEIDLAIKRKKEMVL